MYCIECYLRLPEQPVHSQDRVPWSSGIQGPTHPYTLMTCAGIGEAGRREYGYIVESVDGKVYIPLPMLVECNNMPSNQDEISISMLFIRNTWGQLHIKYHLWIITLKYFSGLDKLSCSFKRCAGSWMVPLGWLTVGVVCRVNAHKPNEVSALKTCILSAYLPGTRMWQLVARGKVWRLEKDGCICRNLRNRMFLHICKTGFTKKDLTQAHGYQMCAAWGVNSCNVTI